MAELTLQGLQQLAEEMWEGCHGGDDTDKYMWTVGFVNGYLHAKFSSDDNKENDKEINPAQNDTRNQSNISSISNIWFSGTPVVQTDVGNSWWMCMDDIYTLERFV